LTYVWIPPGRFTMGCSSGDAECSGDEEPSKNVNIAKGFWMGQTEVTQAAYKQVMGKNPSKSRGSKLPVEMIDWNEARDYCGKVGMQLPNETEWEYAARAGSTGARYASIRDIAWYEDNSGNRTHEVAGKGPNAWGLYDMLGNVWEWTATEKQKEKVTRGGCKECSASATTVTYRPSWEPESRRPFIGFRCVGESLP
jgi:formylglycine-generating enzyme required for sulfatase activity